MRDRRDNRSNRSRREYDDYYEEQPRPRRRRKKNRKFLFIVEILVLFVLAVGLFAVAKFSKLQKSNISKGDIAVNENISDLDLLDGYTNIALYGVDSREGSLERDAHSDTIIICSINNKTKEVKLASVFRDTYLDNTNGEYRKATECYYFGGPERSVNMLNKNLDLNISGFVTVDFSVLAEVVDLLGGIEIDVQQEEISFLNDYQVEGSQVTGKEIVPVTQPGLQTLNGLQALSYCRIRYTEGSDYKRTERQRDVIGKIMEKAKSTDLLKLNTMVDEVLPNMLTSLSTGDILKLATGISSYSLTDSTGWPFKLSTAQVGTGDCVIPQTLTQNVIELHQWLFGSDGYTPSATVQEINDTIINHTGIQ